MKLLVVVLCVLYYSQCLTNGARILAILPFPARSHYAPVELLLKRLVERGHQVKVLSHFPQKQKIANFTDVDVSKSLTHMLGSNMPIPVDGQFLTVFGAAKFLWERVGPDICKAVLEDPEVKQIFESNEQFDILFSEIFTTDCFLGFVHKFDSSYIGISTSVPMPWIPDAISNPDNPSYIPHFFSHYSDRMNYIERFLNTINVFLLKIGYKLYADTSSHEVAKKYFGPDLPSFDILRSKVGLVLANTHHAVTAPRPLAPGVKEVGGIHIPVSGPPKLPKDLGEYLDSATEGVVYFSMGSQLNSSTFPEESLDIFIKAFADIPQRVLWKCNAERMPQLPKNVKCLDWIPQLSVLCHPNVKVFFSHGGLLGTQEAVYCGVPVLGMPFFGDQFMNIANSVERGYALQLDFQDFSYEEFSNKLKKLLTDPSYSERVKEASRRFRDRPQAPLDEAVFWVEYVLRHGPGALKTAASELVWYQYLLLDVVAGIFLVLFAVFWILKKLAGAIFSRFRKQGVEIVKRKKN